MDTKDTEIPKIYDITTDELRPATQEDLDRLQDFANIHGHLRYLLRNILNYPHDQVPAPFNLKANLELLRELNCIIDAKRVGAKLEPPK